MVRVHVGLHLEHEAGDFVVGRLDGRGPCAACARGGGALSASADEQIAHAEILQRRAEIDRRQMAFAIGAEIEARQAGARQLDLLFELALLLVRQQRRMALPPMRSSLAERREFVGIEIDTCR